MKKMKVLISIIMVVMILVTSCKDENNPTQTPTTGTIQGKVTNATGDSVIVGATVSTNPPTSSVTSNSTGDYTIPDISPGQYSVTAVKGGYNSGTVTITVTAGKTTTANIPLNLSTISVGLIAYYPFNSNSNDESGNDNHGINNGATLSTDRFGNTNKAYSFNGTSNYIDILPSASLDFSGSFSISVWSKRTSTNDERSSLLATGGSNWTKGFLLQHRATGPHFEFSDGFGTGIYAYRTTGNTYDNQWHHFIVVVDRVSQKINTYQDGTKIVSDKEISTEGNIHEVSKYLLIGKLNSVPYDPQFMTGNIDDIRIYIRVISANEIQILYHEGGW